MKNRGIDYGMGKTNIDNLSGIRFGVIHANSVGSAWYDDSEPEYGEVECPHCHVSLEGFPDICPECEEDLSGEFDCLEPVRYSYKGKGYVAVTDTDMIDIFITKSPYYTYAQFCSPCAPGACYLESPLDEPCEDNKAYCLGHDWFEGQKAPYPVYDVVSGELVKE